MRQRREAALQVQPSTVAAAALCALIAACASKPLLSTPNLPTPPTTTPVVAAYVQVGNRVDGTLRFEACRVSCPQPTPKVPIDDAEMLAERAAALQGREEAASEPEPSSSSTEAAHDPILVEPAGSAKVLQATSGDPRLAAAPAIDPQPGVRPPHVVDVLFLNNSAVLGPQGRRQVLFAAHFAPEGSLLRVMGRTDAQSYTAAAERLAAERAAAVATALRRAGISEDRIGVSHLASGDWVGGKNATSAERAANRRAIVAVKPSAASAASSPEAELDEAQYLRLAQTLSR